MDDDKAGSGGREEEDVNDRPEGSLWPVRKVVKSVAKWTTAMNESAARATPKRPAEKASGGGGRSVIEMERK